MHCRSITKFLWVALLIVITAGLAAGKQASASAAADVHTEANPPDRDIEIALGPMDMGSVRAENVEYISSLGGVSWAIDVQGSYAYLGEGRRLTIIDVSNPAEPAVIGKTPRLAAIVTDVAVAGNYAYVAMGDEGLRIINVADPAIPIELGVADTPGTARSVAKAGDFVYVADGDEGLRVINVTNPMFPVETGFYNTAGFAAGVTVVGSLAYLADSDDGLRIINVANPAAPSEVGFFVTSTNARDVAVHDHYAYVATQFGFNIPGGLRIIDIADKTNPIAVGSYDIDGGAYNLELASDRLYAIDSYEDIFILSIADPIAPSETGMLHHDSGDLAVVANILYSADQNGGLLIVDVTTPANPTTLAFHDVPGASGLVTVTGNHAYVVDTRSLNVVAVGNPTTPHQVGSIDNQNYAVEMDLVGDYAYIVTGALRIVDISDPNNPVEIGSTDSFNGEAIDVFGDYAYVTEYDEGLHIIDVSDPTAPTQVAFFATTGRINDVAVSRLYAYVADWQDGLKVIDIADPVSPVEVGIFDPAGSVAQVTLAGHYAYASQCYLGVSILDVADPTMPTQVGFFPTPGYCYPKIEVIGKYAYVLDDDILHIVNVADPTHPTEVAFYPAPTVGSYAVLLNHIYLADGDDGLTILRFSGIPVRNSYLALIAADR